MLELTALFASALTSATILPGSSEAVLVGLIALKTTPLAWLLIAAIIGNVAGSIINWTLGYYARSLEAHPRFPLKPEQLARYEQTFARYGRWSLLACWVPVIGDPLTIAAGLARTPLIWFIPLVAMAKAARYLVVTALAVQVF
jgi:membrane protein YqaA with SNARE-associated domain